MDLILQKLAEWAWALIAMGASAIAVWLARRAKRRAGVFLSEVRRGLSTVTSLDKQLASLNDRIGTIELNLGENGGKSLGAKISRIDRGMRGLRATVVAVTNLFDEQPLLLFCDEGQCEHANRRFLDLTGYSRTDMLAHGWISAVDESERDRFVRAFHRAVQDRRLLETSVIWRHREGYPIYTTFSMRALTDDESGAVLSWMAELRERVQKALPEVASA